MATDHIDALRAVFAYRASTPAASARTPRWTTRLAAIALCSAMLPAYAQTNGVGQRPYLGWSTFSQQTIVDGFLTQDNMIAQSDALARSGLTAHGYRYLNLDSGWTGPYDGYGRVTSGLRDINALVAHVHRNGQKLGVYWVPGVQLPAVEANYPIFGTPYRIRDILAEPHRAGNAFGDRNTTSPYHYKIDFSKPGAQEYVDSVVAQIASYGVDFIKLDGVTPGSYNNDLGIDNRADVEAWSKAIAKTGKPIWLTVSWGLQQDYLSTWQDFSNARRIQGDVECEGRCATITNWAMVAQRFYDLVAWQNDAGPTAGWNDLDSLVVLNGVNSGLNPEERKTAISFWALANSPMYLGGDMTKLDETGRRLLSNDEVIAVNQSGRPAKQAVGGKGQVWVSDQGNGVYYVGLFNLNAFASPMRVRWSELGFKSASRVRDLWSASELGGHREGFDAVVPAHGVRLLKVVGRERSAPAPRQFYEAETAVLGGTARIGDCVACSGGRKVGYLGLGAANTVTFDQVRVPRAGIYLMQVDSLTLGPRALSFSVNGGPSTSMNLGGSSFALPSSTAVPVRLRAGLNRIEFDNATSYASDLDRIAIGGDGGSTPANSITYEAENALVGGVRSKNAAFCEACSGLAKAGNLSGQDDVLFDQVVMPESRTYRMEIDFLTKEPRSFLLSVNGGADRRLDLSGSSWDLPYSAVIEVPLKAGTNTIRLRGANGGFAPDLDGIVIDTGRAGY
ncbi:alpha-galactosidase D [Lysobacter sp. CA199]|uniref:alpha-galactosidase D n=1 Tax=Lysobacter sp. CA199 TaxID=3455608 RepID=UPI003F8D012B